MPVLSPEELALLELSTEDDYALWEAASCLQSLHKNLNEAEAVNLARTAIRSLLDNGLIYLEYHQDLAPPGWTAPPDPEVAPAEQLDEPRHWQVPSGFDFWWIRFGATPDGVRVYRDTWSSTESTDSD
jgi:hypothetical protein